MSFFADLNASQRLAFEERAGRIFARLGRPEPRVAAGMATMPGREEACIQALLSLRLQVDELHVRYDPVPGWTPPLEVRRLADTCEAAEGYPSPRGDFNKFYGVLDASAVLYLTVDDDLRYPPKYVQAHLNEWLRRAEMGGLRAARAVLGVHGTIFHDPTELDYRTPRATHLRCLERRAHTRRQVHVLGTGTTSFLTWPGEGALLIERFSPSFFAGAPRNAADLHLAAYAQRHGIPLWTIPKPSDFLTLLTNPKARSIWNDGVDPESPQRSTERELMAYRCRAWYLPEDGT